MLNFVKSRVVGPVEHPTGHEISRYVYHFEDAATVWDPAGILTEHISQQRKRRRGEKSRGVTISIRVQTV